MKEIYYFNFFIKYLQIPVGAQMTRMQCIYHNLDKIFNNFL